MKARAGRTIVEFVGAVLVSFLLLNGGRAAAQLCGDGLVSPGEVCDDGNTVSQDGCRGDCGAVESGWVCHTPGFSCREVCGDGLVVGLETCDDGDTIPDGSCTSTCQIPRLISECQQLVAEAGSDYLVARLKAIQACPTS